MSHSSLLKYGYLLNDEAVLLSYTKKKEIDPSVAVDTEVRILKTATMLGFVYKGKTYKSPTALCKAAFTRKGTTNEWAGPDHVYVKRGSVWVNIKEAVRYQESID